MIRFAKNSDNTKAIAKLIFNTDPLIQFLFGKKEKALLKIEALVKGSFNVFSYNNVCVYQSEVENEIQGILLFYDPQKKNKEKESVEFQKIFSVIELLVIWIRVLFLKSMENKNEVDGIYVSNISVDEQLRGKGVGTALIDFIESWAISKKYSSMWLDVSFENTNAKKLYERKGFIVMSERNILFSSKGFYRMRKAL